MTRVVSMENCHHRSEGTNNYDENGGGRDKPDPSLHRGHVTADDLVKSSPHAKGAQSHLFC